MARSPRNRKGSTTNRITSPNGVSNQSLSEGQYQPNHFVNPKIGDIINPQVRESIYRSLRK